MAPDALFLPLLLQGPARRPCSETLRPSGIGWKSPSILIYASGTGTISSIGASIVSRQTPARSELSMAEPACLSRHSNSDPPLTAYHSYLVGLVGSLLNPSWFALDTSRGAESLGLKAFMRASVLIWEVFVYWSAVYAWIFWRRDSAGSRRTKVPAILLLRVLQRLTAIYPCHIATPSLALPASARAHPNRQRSLPIQLYHARPNPVEPRSSP